MRFFDRKSVKKGDRAGMNEAIDRELSAWKHYDQFLLTIADKFPEETKSFVLARWYRDPRNHECPHDSWLLNLTIDADFSLERKLNLDLRLLGAYHDKILKFQYFNVINLDVGFAGLEKENVGDWLYDEFDVTEEGMISHEILWQEASRPWKIVAEKVVFTSINAELSDVRNK